MSVPLVTLAAVLSVQQVPTRVEVTAATHDMIVGDQLALAAVTYDADGRVIPDAPVRWIVSTPELASVDLVGNLSAINPGAARVSAVSGSAAGSIIIAIGEMPATDLRIEAPSRELFVGQSLPLGVTALNRLGEEVAVPLVSFGSSDPSVLGVDAGGLVLGRAPGRATVSAQVEGEVSEVSLEIVPNPGLSHSISPATAAGRTGDVIRFRTVSTGPNGEVRSYPSWSVQGIGASVGNEDGEGVFVAEEPGVYRVSARVGENAVVSAVVQVEERGVEAELMLMGRGAINSHHSGDMWVFEGVDGRDYAYVGTFMHDWMKVWDVTDPTGPVLTDSLQLDARRINDVKIHPNSRIGIVTREGASSRRNGMVLLDLADPAHPTVLSEYTETLTGGVHNVWIDGTNEVVYAVHNGTRAVHVIDISDLHAPIEVGRWQIDNEQRSLHDVVVQDGYAYVSYWDDGVVILDVGAGTHGGAPREPKFVSRFKYPVGNTHVAWRHGQYLFVGDEIFPPGWDADGRIEARGYIHVLDVSDIENPVEVAKYEVPEAGAHNLWTEGDRLYIGYYQAGLRVLDISGELRGDLYRQGREMAVILTTDEGTTTPNWPMAWGAQVFKGLIYSSDLNSGLWVTQLKERAKVIS